MALNAFRKTSLNAFVRSIVKARETDIPAPPAPPEVDTFVCHAFVRSIQEVNLGTCDVSPVVTITQDDSCLPTPVDPRYPLNACGVYAFAFFGLKSFSKDHFPLQILTESGQLIADIPDSECPDLEGLSMVSNDTAVKHEYFDYDHTDYITYVKTIGFGTTLLSTLYLRMHLGNIPAVDTLVTVKTKKLAGSPAGNWQSCADVTSVTDPPPGVYTVVMEQGAGDAFDASDSLLRFSGAGVYDGDHLVVFINEDDVECVNLLWTVDVATGSWENNNTALNTTFSITAATEGRVRNSTVLDYNGDYTLSPGEGDQVVIPSVWFNGTASGEILSKGVEMTAVGTIIPGQGIVIFGAGPVTGTSYPNFTIIVSGTTSYDGVYTCSADNTTGTAWIFSDGDLNGVTFVGAQTGLWVEVGNPTNTGPILTVTQNLGFIDPSFPLEISGTIDYDGVYIVNATSNSGDWEFTGGDLDAMFYAGHQPGTWQKQNTPSISGTLQGTTPTGFGLQPFSSAEAERSGNISLLRSKAMSLTVSSHDAQVNGSVYFLDSTAKDGVEMRATGPVGISGKGEFFSIVVSGTTDYDGTYTCTAFSRFGSSFWLFNRGDLDEVVFLGNQTPATWEKSGDPAVAGNILEFRLPKRVYGGELDQFSEVIPPEKLSVIGTTSNRIDVVRKRVIDVTGKIGIALPGT